MSTSIIRVIKTLMFDLIWLNNNNELLSGIERRFFQNAGFRVIAYQWTTSFRVPEVTLNLNITHFSIHLFIFSLTHSLTNFLTHTSFTASL